MLLYPKSCKKCLKNLENWLTNKDLTPKNDFACTREVIQKSLNQNSSKLRDFVQAFGPQLSIFSSPEPKAHLIGELIVKAHR